MDTTEKIKTLVSRQKDEQLNRGKDEQTIISVKYTGIGPLRLGRLAVGWFLVLALL